MYRNQWQNRHHFLRKSDFRKLSFNLTRRNIKVLKVGGDKKCRMCVFLSVCVCLSVCVSVCVCVSEELYQTTFFSVIRRRFQRCGTFFPFLRRVIHFEVEHYRRLCYKIEMERKIKKRRKKKYLFLRFLNGFPLDDVAYF